MYFILRFIVIKVEILHKLGKTSKLLNFVETIKKMRGKKKDVHANFCFCSNLLMVSLRFLDVRSYFKARNKLLKNVVIVSLNTCFST